MKMRKKAPFKIITRVLTGIIIVGGLVFSVDSLDKKIIPCLEGCTSTDDSIMVEELNDFKLAINEIEIEEAKVLIAEEKERKRLAEIEANRIAELKAKLEAKRIAKQKAKEEEKKSEKEKYVAVSRGNGYQSNYEATHYIAYCDTGCTGVTATGYNVSSTIYYQGYRIVAAPKNIPFYTKLRVTYSNGTSFDAIVLDRGGAINGKLIDILVSSKSEAYELGRQKIKLEVIK